MSDNLQVTLQSVISYILVGFLFSLIVPGDILAKEYPGSTADHAVIAELPLIELPDAKAQNDILAIILSGDGGWADLDKVFGAAFQKRGVATVGFDCLKYFWKARQPVEVSKDIDTILRYYLKAWNKKRVLLVGYSFGADWLPFLVNRLPTDIHDQVHLCVLLGPSSFVNVEVHVMDWMKVEPREGALKVLPEALRIKHPVLCVYGQEEEDSICPALDRENVKKLLMPGGHHFNYKYSAIINAIFSTMEEVPDLNGRASGMEKQISQ